MSSFFDSDWSDSQSVESDSMRIDEPIPFHRHYEYREEGVVTTNIDGYFGDTRYLLEPVYTMTRVGNTHGPFPSTLRELSFLHQFPWNPTPGTFPGGLTSLTMGNRFNAPLRHGVLPSSLVYLNLGGTFNCTIRLGVLPVGLKALVLSECYNSPLDRFVLPAGLEELTFGRSFNQPLPYGVLPVGLKKLTFGRCFTRKLSDQSLPSSLVELSFGPDFKQRDVVLPGSLRILQLGDATDGLPLLPRGLASLSIAKCADANPWARFPENLTFLCFGNQCNPLLSAGVLPSSLKKLWLGSKFNRQPCVTVFPSRLEDLVFSCPMYSGTFYPGDFPKSLKTLEFRGGFGGRILPRALPSDLEALYIGTPPSGYQNSLFVDPALYGGGFLGIKDCAKLTGDCLSTLVGNESMLNAVFH